MGQSTMKKWHWGLAAISLLGVAGGLLWFWKQESSAPSNEQAVLEADWPVGRVATYAIHWESTALAEQLNQETQNPEPKVLSQMKVDGELRLTRIPGPSSQILLHADLVEPSLDLQLEDGRATKQRAELERELDQPFVIEMNRRGLVERVQMPPAIGSAGFGAFKSIAALLQRSIQENKEETWVALEADLTGKAELEYSLSGRTLTKEKLRYVSLVQGAGLGAQAASEAEVTITQSKHLQELGDNWFSPAVKVDVNEATLVTLGGAFAPMTSQVHLTLTLTDTSDTSKDKWPRFSASEFLATRLDQLPSEEAQRREREQQSVDGRSVAQLTKSIGALEQLETRDRQKEARVFSALTSKMRLDPEAQKEAEKNIRADKDRMLLLDALGSAGTPETQALLVKLIDEVDLGREQTRSSLINLSMSEEPTSETIEALKKRTSDPSHGTQSTYGLGSAAYHLRDKRPQDAIAVVQDLITRLEATTDDAQKAALLKALGNSGNSLALNSCEAHVSASSVQLRSAAADCARLIDGPRADMVLAKLVRDPETTVAKTAVNAALQRTYSSILDEPLTELALSDRPKHLRIAATQVLAGWMKTQPSLATAVRRIADNDPDEELRAYAQRMLSKLS